jgi:pimeloyl-ACP methyl ester carboxylesterase
MSHKFFFLILIAFLMMHCSKEDGIVEQFFLKNDEAVMPVLVKGNTASKVFIILLHGGPGDGAIRSYSDPGFFDVLEERYAMVYWDQRCAGLSQGNCNPEGLDVAAYVNDLEKLVRLVNSKYDIESLFLLGHSWGGTLGLSYLIKGNNQIGIKGFINADGPHNFPLTSEEAKSMILTFGSNMVNKGIETEAWNNLMDRVRSKETDKIEDVSAINKAGYATQDVLLRMDSINDTDLKFTPHSLISGMFPSLMNQIATSSAGQFFQDFISLDLSDSLKNIIIPVDLLYGRFDFVIPPATMLDCRDQLINAPVETFEFTRSHHSPMIHENSLFNQKVIEFVEEYR